jgi:hypothetical protein
MPAHKRLLEELRKSRRTIADAIEVLRDAGGFSDHDHAEVRIGPLHLSSGDVVSLVDVLFEAPFWGEGLHRVAADLGPDSRHPPWGLAIRAF